MDYAGTLHCCSLGSLRNECKKNNMFSKKANYLAWKTLHVFTYVYLERMNISFEGKVYAQKFARTQNIGINFEFKIRTDFIALANSCICSLPNLQ